MNKNIEAGTSYIDTVKSDLYPRKRAVLDALELMHAFAEDDGDEGSIEMPIAYRNPTPSSDTVWFNFSDRLGDTLTPEDIGGEDSSLTPVVGMMLEA